MRIAFVVLVAVIAYVAFLRLLARRLRAARREVEVLTELAARDLTRPHMPHVEATPVEPPIGSNGGSQ